MCGPKKVSFAVYIRTKRFATERLVRKTIDMTRLPTP